MQVPQIGTLQILVKNFSPQQILYIWNPFVAGNSFSNIFDHGANLRIPPDNSLTNGGIKLCPLKALEPAGILMYVLPLLTQWLWRDVCLTYYGAIP